MTRHDLATFIDHVHYISLNKFTYVYFSFVLSYNKGLGGRGGWGEGGVEDYVHRWYCVPFVHGKYAVKNRIDH